MRRASKSLLLVGLAQMLSAVAALAQTAGSHEAVTWRTIVNEDGAVLGHASSEVVRRPMGRDVVETQDISLQELGGSPTYMTARNVRSEDAEGAILSLSATSRAGRFWTRTEARISNGAAHIVRETPSGRWTHVAPLPAAVRFDDGEGLLLGWDPLVTPRLEFNNFNLDAMDVERVVIEAAPNPTGGALTAMRRRYDRDQLIGIARLTLDREGRVVDAAQPMFGATIHMHVTDRATALGPHPPYQVVPNAMTRSPFRISASASQGRVRYRLSFKGGIAFALPQTGEQRASQDGETVTVDICRDCGPGMPADAASLADALRPTNWLQSDHPRLRAIAAPVASLAVSDTSKMQLLLQRARPYLARIDFAGHYSALDTLSRRAGDCTEAAVLLAALGRAAGIPTRVASGLVYSRGSYHGVSNAFLPHSWTIAWVDGAWRSFDLALGDFDSTHIALTVGDGDARSVAAAGQLASLLRFETLAEIRVRGQS